MPARAIIHVLVHDTLVEPFYSTGIRDAGVSATGLGLASIYAIVTQLGGCVSVTSEMGEGSAFEILLPAASLP